MGLIDSIIGAESGGNPNATNPNSSAAGPGQFIDSTWLDVIRKSRPDLADQPDSALLALKTNPEISRQATEAYAQVKVLQADPTASVADILGPGVVKANPFLAKMTAADLQSWAARKMGGAASTQAPQQAAAAPAAPMSLAPPAAAPTFAQAPQTIQFAGSGQGGGAYQPPPAAPLAAPIFAQRRTVDLAKLRAAFPAPTFFAKG